MSEAAKFSIELFPKPKGVQVQTLDTGEPYLHKARILKGVIFAVQPQAEGALSLLRSVATNILFHETGMNVGYGFLDWRDKSLEEWLSQPNRAWAFDHGLAWEVTVGLALWLACFAGAPDEVRARQLDFLKSASDEAMRGDFSRLANDGRVVPTLDALVGFFRDSLLNRLLENVPRLKERFVESIDEEIRLKIREWTLPPTSLWRAALKAEQGDPKAVLRTLVNLRDDTNCSTSVQCLVWRAAEAMSHLELVDVSKLSSYYFGEDYVPPMDGDSLAREEVQMFLPAVVEGPANGFKPPESFGDFLEKYYRKLHVVQIDQDNFCSLVPLLQPVTSSRAAQKRDLARQEELRRTRRAAKESLCRAVEALEPSTIYQANIKAIVGQWFVDEE